MSTSDDEQVSSETPSGDERAPPTSEPPTSEPPTSEPSPPSHRKRAAGDARIALFGRMLLAIAVAAAALLAFKMIRGDSEMIKKARVIEARAREKHRPKKADTIATECRKGDCECALAAARAGLDLDLSAEVLALVPVATNECPKERALSGIRAEALVRASAPEGVSEAHKVLATDASNANANYALALASFRERQYPQALERLQQAVSSGRGPEARLLVGLIGYTIGQLDFAAGEFQQMEREVPEDPAPVYNRALIAHRLGRYSEAREGYLKVLRLNPEHADARFNLAVLTHSAGFVDEAKHHLSRFKELKVSPESIQKLSAIVLSPPPARPQPAEGAASAAPPSSASP